MSKHEVVGTVIDVDTEYILRFPDQPRKFFSKVRIISLAKSIDRSGQRTPAIVTPVYDQQFPDGKQRFYLVNGERRKLACVYLKRPLRCVVQYGIKNQKKHYIESASANFNTEPHLPMEIAEVVNRFRTEFEMPWDEIEIELGMGRQTMIKYLNLIHLHPQLQKLLGPETPRDQKISVGVAEEISHLPPERQLVLVKEILGQRSDIAKQTIRRYLEEARNAGEKVRDSIKGRKRRPSDDSEILDRRLKRIVDDMAFISGLPTDQLNQAFRGRKLEANARTMSTIGQITSGLVTMRKKVEGSMPEEFRKRLPKPA